MKKKVSVNGATLKQVFATGKCPCEIGRINPVGIDDLIDTQERALQRERDYREDLLKRALAMDAYFNDIRAKMEALIADQLDNASLCFGELILQKKESDLRWAAIQNSLNTLKQTQEDEKNEETIRR